MDIEGIPSVPATTVTVSAGLKRFTKTVPAGWMVGRAPMVCAVVAVFITTYTSSVLPILRA